MRQAPIVETATGFTKDALEALSEQKAEPDWLRERRLLAWRIFEDRPLPFWRRTDISSLRLDDLLPYHAPAVNGGPFNGLPADMRLARDDRWRAGVIVQRDSAAVYSTLAPKLAAQGVIFTDLDTAVQKYPDLVREHLMNSIAAGEDKFAALHAAFWSGGTFLYVPKGVSIALPLVSLSWMDTPGLALFTHTLIVAEAGSKVHLLEEFGSPRQETQQALHSGMVEIVAGDQTDVAYAEVQNWGPAVITISHKKATVGRNAVMRWIGAHLGSKLTHMRLQSDLPQPGSEMYMMGVMLADGRQHFDIDSYTTHIAPHTKADVLYRGIVRDRARTVFQGLIKVEQGAQQTDSYLANHNLLLSSRARADAVPTLEIEANDVRCTHGATVGQLDEEQLFYMMCRGLSREDAERLIVAGFVQPVLDRIPQGALRARVTAAVHAKLAGQRS